MKITKEQFELAKKLQPTKLSNLDVAKLCQLPKTYMHLINRADTYEALEKLYKNTFNQPKKVKVVEVVKEAPEPATKHERSNAQVVTAIASLEAKIDEMLESYKWIVERAQIDYRKKKWFPADIDSRYQPC